MRLSFVNKENTHSWVRISHESNKFVMNLRNNEQEIPEVQLEEYAFKLDAKDFASRSKAKAKPQEENLPALPQEQFLLRKELGPMFNQGNIHSPIMKYRRNWFIFFVMGNMCIEKMMEQFISGELKTIFRNISCVALIGLIANGRKPWQEEEETRKYTSTVLILQERLHIGHHQCTGRSCSE